MIIFIGMETSGELRRRFQAAGHETYSCDLLPSQDGGEEMAYSKDGLPLGRHLVGDVFETLDNMRANDMWPEAAVFHPTCTYLTNSAEWAYGDGPYHQEIKPGTLVGAARREAREEALNVFRRIMALPIKTKVIENPVGAANTRIRKASQIVQPNRFGDNASKATCFWFVGERGEPLPMRLIPMQPRVRGRFVPISDSRVRERWENQTDAGQNRLSPSDDRWQARSDTFPGIADAIVSAVLNQRTLF